MSGIVMLEGYVSREGSRGQSNSYDLKYVVMNSDLSYLDPVDAKNYVIDNMPFSQYNGFDYIGHSVRQIVLGIYEFTLNYGTDQFQTTTNASTIQFNIGGGTIHITNSISKTDYRDTDIWPAVHDYKGAIGVKLKNGQPSEVTGVDIIAPVMEFSYQTLFNAEDIDDSYIEGLFNLCGRVNNAQFAGRPAGSLLFKGAHGSRKGDDKWEIGFDFAYSKNASSLTIGAITVTTKKGWDYLDVIYVPKGRADGSELLVPAQATVHKVYYDGNFSVLGID